MKNEITFILGDDVVTVLWDNVPRVGDYVEIRKPSEKFPGTLEIGAGVVYHVTWVEDHTVRIGLQ